MPDSDRSVPFIALNGCLRDDFLQRVLHRSIESLPRASSASATAVTAALRTLSIPGFRQATRAPRGLQARAAVSRFRESGAFVGQVLELWVDANEPLASSVDRFLEAQGIPRNRVQAEAGQFADRWSLEQVMELADRFRADEPKADRDDVALMLCCLTSRAPIEEAEPAAEKAEDRKTS